MDEDCGENMEYIPTAPILIPYFYMVC
jgi:hypothetical protein